MNKNVVYEVDLDNPEDIKSYMEDRENVFGDPDRFGLAYLVVFRHSKPQEDFATVTMEHILQTQKEIDMQLSAKEAEAILDDWIAKGYASSCDSGYKATDKLKSALAKDGVTRESLTRLADVFFKS